MNHLKTYTKSELASLYGIHVNTLMNWLRRDDVLMQQLAGCGYKPSQKILTPAQVHLINSRFTCHQAI